MLLPQVIRLGGALGEVTLYWTVMADAFALEADPASDVSNPSGNVTFAVNEMSLSIEIFTVDDEVTAPLFLSPLKLTLDQSLVLWESCVYGCWIKISLVLNFMCKYTVVVFTPICWCM